MKLILSLFAIILSYTTTIAQQKVVKMGETKYGFVIEVTRDVNGYSTISSLRLGPQSKNKFLKGIKKAQEWSALNEEHQLTFTKEILRFTAMDIETYKLHGYNDNFAQTVILNYYGVGENSKTSVNPFKESALMAKIDRVKLEMNVGGYLVEYMTILASNFNDAEKLLKGEKLESPIDEIFKN